MRPLRITAAQTTLCPHVDGGSALPRKLTSGPDEKVVALGQKPTFGSYNMPELNDAFNFLNCYNQIIFVYEQVLKIVQVARESRNCITHAVSKFYTALGGTQFKRDLLFLCRERRSSVNWNFLGERISIVPDDLVSRLVQAEINLTAARVATFFECTTRSFPQTNFSTSAGSSRRRGSNGSCGCGFGANSKPALVDPHYKLCLPERHILGGSSKCQNVFDLNGKQRGMIAGGTNLD